MLGHALAAFDLAQLRDRWDIDVRTWIAHAVVTWVQRCKSVKVDLEELGVHISMHTQDDCGYYAYEFDVMPRSPLPPC